MSKIILKKSSVAAKVPVPGDLEYGELAINYTDGVLYYKNSDTTVQVLNPSVAAAVTYTPNSLSLTNGVYVSGSVTDIQTYNDGNFYQITDGTGTGPAWIITVTFTGVTSFNRVVANVDYTVNSGHTVYIQIYNNTTLAWDNLGAYSGSAGYTQYALAVLEDTTYISSGTVQTRIYHSNTGNAAHTTKLEYFALEQTTVGSQGPRGPSGTAGAGLATGGSTGQYLRKASATDYDTAWNNITIDEITSLQTTLNGKEDTGIAAGLITTHEAAADPHPQYATLPEIATATGDIQGIVDRTASTISFVDGTRTFSVTPVSGSWTFYYHGTLYTVSSTKSITIANTSGARFIYIDPATLNLVEGSAIPDFANNIYLAYVYWDSGTSKSVIVGDERHGSYRDTTWHTSQHANVGTVWRSGGGLTYTLNDPSAVTLTVGTPLIIADEDLIHTINHSASPTANYEQILNTASLEVLYLSGTTYTSTTQSTTPWVAGTSLARYNFISGGSGSLVDAAEGNYITYWLLATNDIKRPVKLVLGRVLHTTIDSAYAEDFTEYGLSFAEQVFMYQIVVQTSASYTQNTAKIKIAGVRKISSKVTSTASTVSATNHSNLTGLQNVDSHPISAITNLQSSLNAKQDTLVSNTNIKTVNSNSLLGSGDIAVQATLVSGTNIKTVNGNSLLGSGDLVISGGAGGGLTLGQAVAAFNGMAML